MTAARPKERDLLAGVKPLAQDLKLSKADQPRTTGAAVGLGAGPWGCPTPCPPQQASRGSWGHRQGPCTQVSYTRGVGGGAVIWGCPIARGEPGDKGTAAKSLR